MLAASSTRQMNPYLERALSIISLQSSSTIDHSYKTHLSRSKTKTMQKLDLANKIAAKRSGLAIDNTSRSNINNFLREPSAHELPVSSQLTAAERVSEIIEDLKRQTTEEIDSWSWSLDLDYDPLKEMKTSPSIPTSGQSNEAILYDGHRVSSPISLVQTPVAVSNMASVLQTPATSEKGTKKHGNVHTRGQSSTSETPKDPFTLPNKPSFQSFLSRVAKTPPPPPTVVRDFAYPQSPSVSLLLEHSKEAEPRTQAVVEPLRTTSRVKPSRQNYSKLIRSRTAMALPKSDLTAVGNSHFDLSQPYRVVKTEEPLPASRAETQRNLPRLISTPLLRETESSNVKPSTKRKPLPKDSPLFVPLAEHPAFANLPAKRKETKITPPGTKTKELRDVVWKEDELDRLNVLLPLPPSPSSLRL